MVICATPVAKAGLDIGKRQVRPRTAGERFQGIISLPSAPSARLRVAWHKPQLLNREFG
jgi:hypothetical protein